MDDRVELESVESWSEIFRFFEDDRSEELGLAESWSEIFRFFIFVDRDEPEPVDDRLDCFSVDTDSDLDFAKLLLVDFNFFLELGLRRT